MSDKSTFFQTNSLEEAKAKCLEAELGGNLDVHVFDTVTQTRLLVR